MSLHVTEAGPVVGVDLGGTHLRVATVGPRGTLLQRAERNTPREAARPDALVEMVREALAARAVSHVVVGVPGPVAYDSGAMLWAPNLPPSWREGLSEVELSEAVGVPVYLANDADLAAVGEARFGGGKGCEDMVYVTVSTGIGAGVILRGRLARGARSIGEIGHTVIDMSGAERGTPTTLEELGSGTALGIRAAQAGLGSEGAGVAEAVARGDEVARAIWEETARAVAVGVGNMGLVFGPEVVVLGGGLGRSPGFIEAVRAKMGDDLRSRSEGGVPLVAALLGDDAGLVGAAGWVQALHGGG